MSGLIESHFTKHDSKVLVWHFYWDRVLRLVPQYFFYVALTATWFFWVGRETWYLNLPVQPLDWVNNLLVVPLNYFMFNHSERFTLIPPAWSLGAEIQFYLIVPFLIRSKKLFVAIMLLAFLVFLTASFGVIHTDWWGYRLLPGIMVFFGVGMLLFRAVKVSERAAKLFCAGVFGAVIALWVVLSVKGLLHLDFTQEVLIGLAGGVILVNFLSVVKNGGKIDELLGNASYGVFLNHYFFIWLFDWDMQGTPTVAEGMLLLGVCIVVATLTQRYVESPVLALRRRIRNRL